MKMPEIGDLIHIDNMEKEPQYKDKEGTVDHIDAIGQIHGTWGGCALDMNIDKFHIITK